ncbi:MAG: histidine kinase dimerization/phospho-acceptor domain-containing protein [Desulfovibrio sp.]|nr:histidine kinase dimerization/phospho-acceptor domain-containing protein [Desulfovibrio sp.]
MTPASASRSMPLQFVKVLSWSILMLILAFNLGFSFFVSNYAENTLLEKQKEFGLLLAENLSHQIYTRFTLPTLVGYGRIRLRNEEQFTRLDQTVRTTIHSFRVEEVRIYSLDQTISYATDKKVVGTKGEPNKFIDVALDEQVYSFDMQSRISRLGALVRFNMPPGTMKLRTYYPLRSEKYLGGGPSGHLMGVLEFTQDITHEYVKVVNFERLVVASALATSLLLFYVIMTVLRRTERINAIRLEEKERLERELMQQEKLAGMGRMVAGVAHEIRNPLGIIRSTSEHLLKKAQKEGGGSQSRLLEAIHEESERLSKVVTDFLDYARPRQPDMREVDLGRIVEQVSVFLEHECKGKGVSIQSEMQPGLSVRGDKDQLYRAFYNIVSNSLQALDGPGTITISGTHELDVVHMIFMDDGPGFASEHMDKLKDPFFTTKETGTGLGLAIVGSIFEGHGTQWTLSCGVEGGARVDVIFPAGETRAD